MKTTKIAITILLGLLLIVQACTPITEPQVDKEEVQSFCDANVDYRILRACSEDNTIKLSLANTAEIDILGIVGALIFEEGDPHPFEITGFTLPTGLDGELAITHTREETPKEITIGPIVNENGAPTLCIRNQEKKEIEAC